MKSIKTLFVSAFALAAIFIAPSFASAADIYVGGTASSTPDGSIESPFATIQDGVTAAIAGDTIIVSGSQVVTTTVSLNKQVTLSGNGASIETTGSNQVFNITSSGVTIQGFNFNKTDAVGDLIGVQADNVTISNNHFVGIFNIGDSQVSRAMVISPGVQNITITNNTINHLRQPAYFDRSSGTVSGNYVSDTKGWVVSADATLVFTNNTWGTNVFDIAVIANASVVNNYDAVALRDANNGANVENQFGGTPVLADVYVNAAAAPAGNGTNATPYQTLDATAISRVAVGGTIHLLSDVTTNSEIFVNKSVIINGGNHKIIGNFVKDQIGNNSVLEINGTTAAVVVKNLTVDGGIQNNDLHGINIWQANNVLLDNVSVINNGHSGIVSNASVVTVNNIKTENNNHPSNVSEIWSAINVDKGTDILPSTLTVTGVSTHSESTTTPQIYIDDYTTGYNTVIDNNNQYDLSTTTVAATYTLKAPMVVTPPATPQPTSRSGGHSGNATPAPSGTLAGQVLGAETVNWSNLSDEEKATVISSLNGKLADIIKLFQLLLSNGTLS